MQVFQRNDHPAGGFSETIGMSDVREGGTYPQISQADTAITYLYRSGQDAERSPSAVSSIGQITAAEAPSRRYEQTTYLQVDWDGLRNCSTDRPAMSSTSSRGLANVYVRVLERAENRLGSDLVADLLLLIHVSRNGLGTDELVAISGCTSEQVAGLGATLQNHVVVKGGRISLLNVYIARAIEARYAGFAGELAAGARERIALYFESQEHSSRVAEELPWQLLELGALDRLQSCVTDAAIVAALCNAGRRGDLYLYWNALDGHVDLTQAYRTSLGESNDTVGSELFALLDRFHSIVRSDRTVESPARSPLFNQTKSGFAASMMYTG
jgi:hypothetical protein